MVMTLLSMMMMRKMMKNIIKNTGANIDKMTSQFLTFFTSNWSD